MPLQIVRHDITKMRVDAIVNTTNEEMKGYSGVDLAVHTIAGEELDSSVRQTRCTFTSRTQISASSSIRMLKQKESRSMELIPPKKNRPILWHFSRVEKSAMLDGQVECAITTAKRVWCA